MRLLQKELTDNIQDLESQLTRSLRRVEPREEFVDHLHNRLTTPPTMMVERRTHTALGLLVISSSLLLGLFLVWLLRQFRSRSA